MCCLMTCHGTVGIQAMSTSGTGDGDGAGDGDGDGWCLSIGGSPPRIQANIDATIIKVYVRYIIYV